MLCNLPVAVRLRTCKLSDAIASILSRYASPEVQACGGHSWVKPQQQQGWGEPDGWGGPDETQQFNTRLYPDEQQQRKRQQPALDGGQRSSKARRDDSRQPSPRMLMSRPNLQATPASTPQAAGSGVGTAALVRVPAVQAGLHPNKDPSSAALLTAQIKGVTALQSLRTLVHSRLPDLNALHVSCALAQLVSIQATPSHPPSPPTAVLDLAQHLAARLDTCMTPPSKGSAPTHAADDQRFSRDPAIAVHCVWALATLGAHCPPTLLQRLAAAACGDKPHKPPQPAVLCPLMWGLAKLGLHDPDTWRTLAASASERVRGMLPRDIAMVTWSLAKARVHDQRHLVASLCRAARGLMHHYEPRHQVMLLWSMAVLRHHDVRLADELMQHASGDVLAFKPHQLCTMLWSVANFQAQALQRQRKGQLLGASQRSAQQRSGSEQQAGMDSVIQLPQQHSRSEQQGSMHGVMQSPPSHQHGTAESLSMKGVRTMNLQHVASFVEAAGPMLLRRLTELSARDATSLLWALQRLQQPQPADGLAAAAAAHAVAQFEQLPDDSVPALVESLAATMTRPTTSAALSQITGQRPFVIAEAGKHLGEGTGDSLTSTSNLEGSRELLNVILYRCSTPGRLAAAAAALAAARVSEPVLLSTMCDVAGRLAGQAQPMQATRLLDSLARLVQCADASLTGQRQTVPAELVSQLAQRAAAGAQALPATQLAAAAHSCAALGHRSRQVFGAFVTAALSQLQQLRPRELSLVLLAAAQAGHASTALFAAAARQLEENAAAFRMTDVERMRMAYVAAGLDVPLQVVHGLARPQL